MFVVKNFNWPANSDVFREQKSGSGWVWVLLFGVGLGSGTNNDGEFPSGFGFLGPQIHHESSDRPNPIVLYYYSKISYCDQSNESEGCPP